MENLFFDFSKKFSYFSRVLGKGFYFSESFPDFSKTFSYFFLLYSNFSHFSERFPNFFERFPTFLSTFQTFSSHFGSCYTKKEVRQPEKCQYSGFFFKNDRNPLKMYHTRKGRNKKNNLFYR